MFQEEQKSKQEDELKSNNEEVAPNGDNTRPANEISSHKI